MPAKYLPWWKACSSSSSVGHRDPSPANVPAPYGLPPCTLSMSNILAPNVYPTGTNTIPWCVSCVTAVSLAATPRGKRYPLLLRFDRLVLQGEGNML
ncbi:hypothetical protein ZEAMMB73_Zm00001d010699 [Zea mays]|uniref:Uncharacterized protein n=1 Tax=Zea mays TaxID=4577 RepID=A0A1D6FSS7_MAIZE|nr:hypothetical protein ZEAMMB73_Zm00001d010699 [Zea mays]